MMTAPESERSLEAFEAEKARLKGLQKERSNARRAGASASAAPSADGLDDESREILKDQGHDVDSEDDADDIAFSLRADRLGEKIKPNTFFLYWVRDEDR